LGAEDGAGDTDLPEFTSRMQKSLDQWEQIWDVDSLWIGDQMSYRPWFIIEPYKHYYHEQASPFDHIPPYQEPLHDPNWSRPFIPPRNGLSESLTPLEELREETERKIRDGEFKKNELLEAE